MPRFAANLTMLFTEYPVIERFERAAAAGFTAAEFLFPYNEDIAGIRAALDRTGIEHILFNLPVGDFAAGDRGMANNPAMPSGQLWFHHGPKVERICSWLGSTSICGRSKGNSAWRGSPRPFTRPPRLTKGVSP